RRARTAPRLQ
ncbi:hypothetical protein PF001_g31852, partial [Phytophthora fragariae]